VAAAFKINHVTDVYLESHTDCGAYKLSGAEFHSETEELTRLYHDLDTASYLISQALLDAGAAESEVKIHARVVDPDGEVQARPKPVTV
jgi:carbonic anhydrase